MKCRNKVSEKRGCEKGKEKVDDKLRRHVGMGERECKIGGGRHD